MLLTIVYGILFVGEICLTALVGLELVQRLVPAVSRQRSDDVAGFIYAALGVIYAVLLALVVIAVWEEYQAANETVEQEEGTPSGWALIDEIRANLQSFEPRTNAEEQLYAQGLDQVESLADAGRMRLVAAEEGVPGVLWAVLIFGGIAAVSFTYLFGLESTWAHRLMVMILAGVIGLVMFTVGALEHPFSGGARIGTGTVDLILERFGTSRLSHLR